MKIDAERINSLALILNKSNDDTSSQYTTNLYKLIEYLWLWLEDFYHSRFSERIAEEKFTEDVREYGETFMCAVKTCVKNFDADKGEFVSFFIAAFKSQRKRMAAKETQRERLHGMVAGDNCEKEVKRLIKLLKARDIDPCSKDGISKIWEAMEYHKKYKREDIVNMVYTLCGSVVSTELYNDDGELLSIFDYLGECDKQATEEREKLNVLFNNIEEVFMSAKGKKRGILSRIITVILINTDMISDYIYNEFIKKCSFCDDEIMKRYLMSKKDFFYRKKDIANDFQVSEAYISKTEKEFLIKLKEIYKC